MPPPGRPSPRADARGPPRGVHPGLAAPSRPARLGQLRRPGNGVLTPAEQAQFDTAFDTLLREVRERLHDADGRVAAAGRGASTRRCAAPTSAPSNGWQEQARRAREALPELGEPDVTDHRRPSSRRPSSRTTTHDDVSAEILTEEIEESSTILELLDRIASIEEQQLEHQKSQLLLDTRGFFFAFLVSVSVIVAGVAPLVEAEPHERLLIVAGRSWPSSLAGLVYAGVRAAQRRSDSE